MAAKQKPVWSVKKYGDNYGVFFRGSLVESGVFANRKTAMKHKEIAESAWRARTAKSNPSIPRNKWVNAIVKDRRGRVVARGPVMVTSKGEVKAKIKVKRNPASKGTSIKVYRHAFDPRKGDVFYISGKTATIKRVGKDTDGTDYVWFERSVDGITAMSVSNLYQAASVPETSRFSGMRR